MIADARNIKIENGKIQGMDIVSRSKEAHYFTDWIFRQANIFANDIEGDLKVVTTLFPSLQKTVTAIAQQEIDRAYPQDSGNKAPQIAAVILNEDGAIRAMVGGYDYEKSQFNRVTDARRQAGSAFKPFVYLAAIEQGWRPDDMISNERITSGRYRPSNHDGFYSPEATLREALSNSYNVSSVYITKEVGIRHVVDVADRVGIDAEVREELSTALGTVDLSLLDLVGGYATIGQDGRLVTPYGIERIETKDGEVLYEYKRSTPSRVIAYNHADAITSMMQDVVEFGTGQRAQTGFPIAGKTGTTQDYRDALFVGFSSTYTMGVWIGHDDNTSMGRGSYGGVIPATVFKRSMQEAHRGVPARSISSYNAAEAQQFRSFLNDIFSGRNPRWIGGGSNDSGGGSEDRFELNQ
jgi:penicillin-binding protein 1A